MVNRTLRQDITLKGKPDATFGLYSLDVNAIYQAYNKFEKSNYDWDLWASISTVKIKVVLKG